MKPISVLNAPLTRGLNHHIAGRLDAARAAYSEHLAADAQDADAFRLLAAIAFQRGDARSGEDLWSRATMSEGDHNLLGRLAHSISQDKGRFDELATLYRLALRLQPQSAPDHSGLALALYRLGLPSEARFHAEQALKSDPASINPSMLLWTIANAAGDLAEVERIYFALKGAHEELSVRLEFNYGLSLLLMGYMREGWKRIESRILCNRLPTEKLWNGEALAGRTILVLAEQDYGDVIQFSRFAKSLSVDARVIMQVQPALVRLLSSIGGVKVISTSDPLPEHDLHCPLISLPQRLGITLDNIPARHRYLRSDVAGVARWRARVVAPVTPSESA